METFLVYLLKMVTCSAVLFGYYRLALYNEKFHQWNRFYLLASLLLSVTVPFISIPLFIQEDTADLAGIMAAMPWNYKVEAAPANTLTWQLCLSVFVVLVSVVMLLKIVVGIARLVKAYFSHPVTNLDDNVQLIVTEYQHAPFSFFSWLFWRNDIDPVSDSGGRMLVHELAHIEQKHSWDKTFTEILLSLFWMNPFFWLIRRELNTVHEFLADSKAIEKQDGAAFAAMILHAMHMQPAGNNGLVNPFYTSQIKRRLFMITTSQEPQYSYLRRISGLGIMITAVVLLSVSLQRAEAQQNKKEKAAQAEKAPPAGKVPPTITVTGKPSSNKVVNIAVDSSKNNTRIEVVDIISNGEKRNHQPQSANELIDEITVIGEKLEGINHGIKITSKEGKEQPLYIIDGKETAAKEMTIKPSEIASVNVLKDETAIKAYGSKGKNGVIIITSKKNGTATADGNNKEQIEVVVEGHASKKTDPVVYVNGKQISFADMNKIQPNDIEKIDIIKGDKAVEKYGDKGKHGIIEITMKKPVT